MGAVLAQPTVSLSGTSVNCPGGSDATATATLSGTTPGFTYTYLWSTGASGTLSVSGLSAGVHTLTVTEQQTGYQFFDFIVIQEPLPISLDANLTDVPCFGQSAGSIDLSVSGGTAPYSYNWTNAANISVGTSQDLAGLGPGTYTVVVTDNQGCSNTRTYAINEPSAPLGVQVIQDDVSCFLGSDGSMSATVFGGTAPYQYSWNSGLFITPQIDNLAAGSYSLTVTDANGCTNTQPLTLNEPGAILLSGNANDALCADSASGFIDLNVSGGVGGYQYQWTNSQFTLGNTQDLAGIGADTYFVTVTDANGCSEQTNFVVGEPAAIQITPTLTPVACAGESSGAIDLTVAGGTLPYTYAWTDANGLLPFTTEDISSIPAGFYTAIVSDLNGCTITETVQITEPASPLVLDGEATAVACFGAQTGSIDLIPSGGTPPYQYAWSNTFTVQDPMGLAAGNYSVQVTDDNGCMETTAFVVDQPSAPVSITSQITPVSCFGFTDGGINLSTSGGTAPYTYTWANQNFNLSLSTEDIFNVQASLYYLQVTDTNGCVLRDTLEVPSPPELIVELTGTDVLCFGEATGAIDLLATGGTPTYTYTWTNGALSEDLGQLAAGEYGVIVRDGNLCETPASITISQPEAPLSATSDIKTVTCPGGFDGAISLETAGGTTPYQFLWSAGIAENEIEGVPTGAYGILITDGNGCMLTDTFEVDEPDAFSFAPVVTPVSCGGAFDGTIELNVSGGTAPYGFRWADSRFVVFQDEENLTNAPGETYTVTVTDTFGCEARTTVELPEPGPLELILSVTDISCAGESDGQIDMRIEGGTPAFDIIWSQGSTEEDLINLDSGWYSVIVMDVNGCTAEELAYIEEPAALRTTAVVTPASCIDQVDGEVELFPAGGRPDYQFQWAHGDNLNPAKNLAVGVYPVTIFDLTGCALDTVINVGFEENPCLDIPNAFTPNGDGTNDVWRIRDLNIYPDAVLFIFNQWGTKLYEMRPGQAWWDGTYNGKPLPSATYYYTLSVRDDREPYSGPITIVR